MKKWIILGMLVVTLALTASVASADHSWGIYHWARTANPFTLKLVDSVTTGWDSYLSTTSSDWSVSTVLDTAIVAGDTSDSTRKKCPAVLGKDRICNYSYGTTGWLGLAQIWVYVGDGGKPRHIAQGVVKLNDTYFNTSTYNTTAWRNLVSCQEVGHTLGLDHQDTNFDNPNLGTCMDYTSDPSTNQHPNSHDYGQLDTIYGHTDSYNSAKTQAAGILAPITGGHDDEEFGAPTGKKDSKGRHILFEKNLGGGQKLFTWVFWAD